MEKTAKFKDRLEQAMIFREVKPVDLSRATGISESTISQYRSGYAEPKKYKLGLISDALGVDPAWLMGFNTSPDEDDDVVKISMFAKDRIGNQPWIFMPEEVKLMRAYSQADEKTQTIIKTLLDIN